MLFHLYNFNFVLDLSSYQLHDKMKFEQVERHVLPTTYGMFLSPIFRRFQIFESTVL